MSHLLKGVLIVFTSLSITPEWLRLLGRTKYQVSLSSSCSFWCVLSVFKKINSSSKAEFDAYKQCMANNENKFHLCRAQQEAFKASWAAAQWDAPSSFFQHVRVFCCALFLQYSPHVNRTGDACARAVLQTTRVCVDNCKVVYFKITLLIFKILWPLNDIRLHNKKKCWRGVVQV